MIGVGDLGVGGLDGFKRSLIGFLDLIWALSSAGLQSTVFVGASISGVRLGTKLDRPSLSSSWSLTPFPEEQVEESSVVY